MIKLNNKNITYVALADSSNSLKAPKEIWYADSNNSVKLVYRRKDALIEGEDYEKYHWLNGDGSSYINTQIIYLDGVIDLVAMVEGEIGNILGRERLNTSSDYYSRFVILINPSNGLATVFSSEQIGAYITQPLVLQIDIQNDNLTINGQLKSLDFIPNVEANSIYLFAVNRFNNPAISSQSIIKISKFSISSKMNLIPCKLLKPVPKWLDANGIRRQVGECGMIDLVSGKFYGNVNSVGTFTVENYYERKEWLVGDGSAYIDTLRPNELNDVIRFKANVKDLVGIKGVFGNHIFTNNRQSCFFVTYDRYSFATKIFQQGPEIYPSRTDNIEVQINQDKVIVNETDYSIERSGSISNYSMPIFTRRRVTIDGDNIVQEIAKLSLNYFVIDGIMHLIPCTLTMDLPASMDANGISRTKGTSGMWDLVSDRFYGNVANSGTFKAVNLAEGVDYERHKWLIVQYKEYEQATLPIQSNDFNYKYKFYSFGNIGGVLTTNNDYIYYSNVGSNDIWGKSERNNVYRGKFYELNTEISINCDANGITMDGELMPNYGSSPYFNNLKIYCYGSTTAKYALSSITVDGIERYIPVKLLKSIPSKYDANGRARQVGECGMYDTVNDVFYGNVASSGTFSVEDDN